MSDVGHRLTVRHEVVSPGEVVSVQTSAGCEFPFRFCGQALGRPPRVGERVSKGDVDDRMIVQPVRSLAGP
jgi:hypothetical protein